MPEPSSKKPKRPRDVNELGVMIAKLATGEIEGPKKNRAAVELGRLVPSRAARRELRS
jgi:hypothetical protein